LRLTRFYDPNLPKAGVFDLPKDEVVHISRVLRLKRGASIEVFDGRGRAATCKLVDVQRRRIQAEIDTWICHEGPDLLDFTVAVAPPRGRRMTSLVEKLTELGVSKIQPLNCEFGQLTEHQVGKEREAWLKKSIEAAKQCGRYQLPIIPDWISPAQLCKEFPGRGFVGSPEPVAINLWPRLQALTRSSGPFLVAVGPEGGFSDEEKAVFKEIGFENICLGQFVLRIETAALALSALFLGRFPVVNP
jgi:16S rRNA (uracil1498-N3)-methyltransferase